MAKHKSSTTHNILALLLILGIFAALYGRITFEAQANKLVGPDFIRTDGQHLIIHNNKSIYLLDKLGNYITHKTFSQLSFIGKLADMQLLNKDQILLGNQTDKIIYQCTISIASCSRFADLSKHVKDFYKFHYDKISNITLIADTDHHQLLQLDNTTKDISIISQPGDFKFPNDLYLSEDTLYITDTNHHRIAAYTYLNNQLGNLKFDASAFTKYTNNNWPTAFTIDDNNNLWVLVSNGLLRKPDLIKYDRHGKAIEKIPLTDTGEFSFIAGLENSIYITDSGGFKLYKINSQPNSYNDFGSGELQTTLISQRKHKQQLTENSLLMLVVIGVMFILAILVAASAYKREDVLTPSLRQQRRKELHKKLDKTVWLKPNEEIHNKIRPLFIMLIVLFIILALSVPAIFLFSDKIADEALNHTLQKILILFSMLFTLVLLIYLTVKFTLGQRLGTDGHHILITETGTRGFKTVPERILYDNMQIASPQTSINYKNIAGMYFYDEDQFRLYIHPLLSMYGKKIGSIRMFVHQLTNFHLIAYINLLLIFISLAMLYIITQI